MTIHQSKPPSGCDTLLEKLKHLSFEFMNIRFFNSMLSSQQTKSIRNSNIIYQFCETFDLCMYQRLDVPKMVFSFYFTTNTLYYQLLWMINAAFSDEWNIRLLELERPYSFIKKSYLKNLSDFPGEQLGLVQRKISEKPYSQLV